MYNTDTLKKQYQKKCQEQRLKNLIRLREEIAELSVTDFCKQTGLQKPNLTAIEKGDRNLSLSNILMYKAFFSEKYALNVSTDFLLGFTSVIENENQNISTELGLSGKSITILKNWKQYKNNPLKFSCAYGVSDLDILNLLLEDYYNLQEKHKKNGYYANFSIFHFIGTYIFSEHFKKCPTNNIKYKQESSNPEIGASLNILSTDDKITVNGKDAIIINTYDKCNNSADSDKMAFYNINNEQEIYQVSFQNMLKAYTQGNIEAIINRIKERIKERK